MFATTTWLALQQPQLSAASQWIGNKTLWNVTQ